MTEITRKRKTMSLAKKVIIGVALVGSATAAYGYSSNSSRRTFLSKTAAVTAVAGVASASVLPKAALAEEAGGDLYADFITTDSGLKYKVTKEGTGAIPTAGQTVKAHYTGWLDGFDSIKKFDSSRDRSRPFTFKAGAGQVIRGWDESFLDMKVGERRNIVLPPRLGYGDRGAGGLIPGGATLYFDVELLAIQ
jgi:peptidylprolyl isomerase